MGWQLEDPPYFFPRRPREGEREGQHNKKITFSPGGIEDEVSETADVAVAGRGKGEAGGWARAGRQAETVRTSPSGADGRRRTTGDTSAAEEWRKGMFLAVFVHKRTKERERGREREMEGGRGRERMDGREDG